MSLKKYLLTLASCALLYLGCSSNGSRFDKAIKVQEQYAHVCDSIADVVQEKICNRVSKMGRRIAHIRYNDTDIVFYELVTQRNVFHPLSKIYEKTYFKYDSLSSCLRGLSNTISDNIDRHRSKPLSESELLDIEIYSEKIKMVMRDLRNNTEKAIRERSAYLDVLDCASAMFLGSVKSAGKRIKDFHDFWGTPVGEYPDST
jgi:hypothetical protein